MEGPLVDLLEADQVSIVELELGSSQGLAVLWLEAPCRGGEKGQGGDQGGGSGDGSGSSGHLGGQ